MKDELSLDKWFWFEPFVGQQADDSRSIAERCSGVTDPVLCRLTGVGVRSPPMHCRTVL